MKYYLALLAAFLIASPTFAVIDPDPDMMGIYFDTDGNDNCPTIGINTPFNAFAILTNPTVPVFSAYEFGLRVVVPEGMVGLSTGGPDIPSATVNTDCVVSLEDTNFGSVKALFR